MTLVPVICNDAFNQSVMSLEAKKDMCNIFVNWFKCDADYFMKFVL